MYKFLKRLNPSCRIPHPLNKQPETDCLFSCVSGKTKSAGSHDQSTDIGVLNGKTLTFYRENLVVNWGKSEEFFFFLLGIVAIACCLFIGSETYEENSI
ncbi:hypothetical protein [Acaryochloris thomasi]|uniref:hypothetical protein n=1 Tax=Acaryochloris thomasi TaxID=2929456 RepID=UPI000DA6BCBB|nr:hypothetical protein [Acaryochloris thomasi]